MHNSLHDCHISVILLISTAHGYGKFLIVIINHDALFYCFKNINASHDSLLTRLRRASYYLQPLQISLARTWGNVLWNTFRASPNVRDRVQTFP